MGLTLMRRGKKETMLIFFTIKLASSSVISSRKFSTPDLVASEYEKLSLIAAYKVCSRDINI